MPRTAKDKDRSCDLATVTVLVRGTVASLRRHAFK